MTQVLFARQSAASPDFSEFSGERLINWYLRPYPDAGRSPGMLISSSGSVELADAGVNAIRAMILANELLYVAVDGVLKAVTAAGAITTIGAITDDPLTTLTWDGQYLSVCAGGRFWVYTVASDTFAEVTAITGGMVVGGSPLCIAYLDGYVVAADAASDRLVWSATADPTTWDATHFASAEAMADDVVRIVESSGELWVFGERTIEIWSTTGSGGATALARIGGGRIQKGCYSGASAIAVDNGVFWVGFDPVTGSRQVYRADGYQPVRISTYPLEERLRSLTSGTQVRGVSWSEGGHEFYGLRFETGTSWAFDVSTGLWHERSSDLSYGPWNATASAGGYGTSLLGRSDGKIVKLDASANDDAGATVLREAVSLPLQQSDARFTLDRVAVDLQVGAWDLATEPAVVAQISIDGGKSWSRERRRGLGQLGQYSGVIDWHAFGMCREARMRLRVTDKIRPAIYGATYEAR